MSDQSITYNRIPSFDELLAFKTGNMNSKRIAEIQFLYESNPMVKDAIEMIDNSNRKDALDLSVQMQNQLIKYFHISNFIWRRWLGWFGAGLILLTIGGIYFVSNSTHLKNNNQLVSVQEVSKKNHFRQETPIATASKQNSVKNEVFEKSDLPIQAKKEEKNVLENNQKEGLGTSLQKSTLAPITEKKAVKEQTTSPKETIKANKVTPVLLDNKSNVATSSTIVLNLQYVQILQKINPNETSTKTRSSSQYDPLGRGKVTQKEKSFAMEDMPSYPGGDDAIQNYFRGIIRPVTVPKTSVDTKNRSCYVRILVKSNGKVQETEIIGNPPAPIRDQLEKGLKVIPDFNPGKGSKVEYLLSLSY